MIPQYLIRTTLEKHLDLCHLKRMTPHDFRHTYVSMLIHEGYDDTSIAELIGDSVLTVRTVYAHMLPSRRKDVMVVLDKSIPKNLIRYDFIRENHEKEINFSFKFVSQEGKDKKSPI